MVDYIQHTQQRSSSTDKNVLFSSYIKMNIPSDDDKSIKANVNELKQWVEKSSPQILKNSETDVLVEKGSIIIDCVMSGNIADLLSINNLRAIGISIKDGDMVDGLLTYAAIRNTLAILSKDIKEISFSLTKMTRWIFDAKLGDITTSEVKTGAIGNLLRFFEAVDVMRNDSLSAEQRLGSAKRALHNIKKIHDMTLNTDDLALIKNYHAQEIQRIFLVDISELSGEKKNHTVEYNEIISEIKGIFKSNKE